MPSPGLTVASDIMVSETCITLTRYFYTPLDRPDDVLLGQLEQAERWLDTLVTRPLALYQREALLCLASDVLAGLITAPSTTFEKSFLLTAINKGMFQVAAGEFHLFCYKRGRLQPRAYQKRRAEHWLFTTGKLLFE